MCKPFYKKIDFAKSDFTIQNQVPDYQQKTQPDTDKKVRKLAYVILLLYLRPALIIKEPKFYLREYEPRKNSGIRGLSLRTEGAFGNAVFEGLHTPRSALGSLIIAKSHFAGQKNAQKLAYVQFLLYLCSENQSYKSNTHNYE